MQLRIVTQMPQADAAPVQKNGNVHKKKDKPQRSRSEENKYFRDKVSLLRIFFFCRASACAVWPTSCPSSDTVQRPLQYGIDPNKKGEIHPDMGKRPWDKLDMSSRYFCVSLFKRR